MIMKPGRTARKTKFLEMSQTMLEYKNMGLVEVLGAEAVADFAKAMEAQPCDPIVHGILVRAGRAGFHYWLTQEGDTLEKADASFRLAPIKRKINLGLQHFCAILSTDTKYALEFKDSANKWELALTAVEPAGLFSLESSYLSGFLQEFASWAGMGRLYQVHKKVGDSPHAQHSIIIEKEPVE